MSDLVKSWAPLCLLTAIGAMSTHLHNTASWINRLTMTAASGYSLSRAIGVCIVMTVSKSNSASKPARRLSYRAPTVEVVLHHSETRNMGGMGNDGDSNTRNNLS